MRAWVVACLMASMALAGCFGDNDSDSGDGGSTDGGDCPDGGHMDNGDAMTNESADDMMQDDCPTDPGEAESDVAASVNADPSNGTVPFNVTFNLAVTGIANDENLTWELDVDGDLEAETKGNGKVLPGNYTFTYTIEGVYNVTFTATDGIDSWNATTQVVAEAGEEEPPEEPGPEEPAPEPFAGIDEEVFVASTCGPVCTFGGAATVCAGLQAGANGVDCGWIEIPEEAWGKKFTINSDWVEEDPDGAALASCTGGATQIDSYGAGGGEAGTIPPGTGCLVAWEFTGPASTLHFIVEGDF